MGQGKVLTNYVQIYHQFHLYFKEKFKNIFFFKNNRKIYRRKEKIHNIADLQSWKSKIFRKNEMSLQGVIKWIEVVNITFIKQPFSFTETSKSECQYKSQTMFSRRPIFICIISRKLRNFVYEYYHYQQSFWYKRLNGRGWDALNFLSWPFTVLSFLQVRFIASPKKLPVALLLRDMSKKIYIVLQTAPHWKINISILRTSLFT